MSFSSLDSKLDLLESQFLALSASLVNGQPDDLLAGSVKLQRSAVELVQLSASLGPMQPKRAQAILRIKALASGLANLRENLLRQMAYVDRALEIVVPATRNKSTYNGGGAYGQPVRQSGAFSVLAA